MICVCFDNGTQGKIFFNLGCSKDNDIDLLKRNITSLPFLENITIS